MKLSGKCSWFGGPDDAGVSPSEGLAFIYEIDMAPHLFLPQQPPNTSGLARRLNPEKFYIACRWNYDLSGMSKEELLTMRVAVRNPANGKIFIAQPADWGPHEDTQRIADLSPGLMDALGVETDDVIDVLVPVRELDEQIDVKTFRVVISSGHGLKIRGASGVIDEVDEARKVVPAVVQYLKAYGCDVVEFHDDTSEDQQTNLDTICDFHNSCIRDLDVSVHFNAYDGTANGTECFAMSQSILASDVAKGIADVSGMENRGGKDGSGLYFIKHCTASAILIEVGFCDSELDSRLYLDSFDAICKSIAQAISNN